jgi:hypothetical protein
VLGKDRLVRPDETTEKEQGNALSSDITKKSRVNEVDRLHKVVGCSTKRGSRATSVVFAGLELLPHRPDPP